MIVRDPATNGGMLYEVYFDLDLIKIVSSQLYLFIYLFLSWADSTWLCVYISVYHEKKYMEYYMYLKSNGVWLFEHSQEMKAKMIVR